MRAERSADPKSIPSNMELVKVARTMRNMAIRNRPLPLHHRCSGEAWSNRNDPVMFRDHIKRYLPEMDAGAYRLPPDVSTECGKWVICTDRLSGRHCDLLMELIATHLHTSHLFSSLTMVTTYRISEERDDVTASHVTATDWLRLLVRAKATHHRARVASRDTLYQIARKPNGTIAAAASRLTDASRASIVDHNRPHASEVMFF